MDKYYLISITKMQHVQIQAGDHDYLVIYSLLRAS